MFTTNLWRSAFVLVLFVSAVICEVLPSILWNRDNPIFLNLGNEPRNVFVKDTLIFLCPNLGDYKVAKKAQYSKDLQYANIYMVDKAGYDNCNATGALAKVIECKDPQALHYKSITIQEMVPASGIEFKKGHVYYFVDTSHGTVNTVDNLVGGRCASLKMKMKVYVCTGESDPNCPVGNKVVNGGWSDWQLCQSSGIQQRQCNSPLPANGGLPCSGNTTQKCTLPSTGPDPTTASNNNTMPPKKEKRSSSNELNHLSVGALVGIFVAIFVIGCVIGAAVGTFVVIWKIKSNRRKASNVYNRNSIVSTATLRPMSTGSLLY